MKKLLLLCCFIGSCLSVSAQNLLQIHKKDGAVLKFAFSEQPTILPEQTNIVIKTDKEQIEYPISALDYFDFTQSESSIGTISVSKPSGNVAIYTIDGTLVRKAYASEEGLKLSIIDLPAGIYIVRDGNTSYKITKH